MEKFINLLLLSGISVHNVEKCGRREALCTLRTRDLDTVRSICIEENVQLAVVQRGGIPVFIACMMARPVLIAILAISVGALLFFSRRVFAVTITGADRFLTEDASKILRAEGVKIGMPISTVDAHRLETQLTLTDQRISAAFIKTDGVVLKVELIPTTREKDDADDRPCSIYADKDCVILKIAALDGTEFVSVGDAVRKDQLLVCGDVTPEGAEEPILVHAKAQIIGEVGYRFTISVGKIAPAPVRSGKTESFVSIDLFGKRLFKPPGFEAYEIEYDRTAFLDCASIPIRVNACTAYELVLMSIERTDEEMLSEAQNFANEKLLRTIPADARIIAKTTKPVWLPDGSLDLIVIVHTIEKIGYLRYL